jgi:hypothetical protein
MMKHLKKILLGVLALLVLGFFAERALLDSAAASLAERTPVTVPHRALVLPERGTVEVRKAGSGEWTVITEETQVAQGDAVRTGEDASASLNLFEQGVARLDENATITLDGLEWDQETNSFVGKILVESGRLWSRLLDFMAPESSYEVRTPHLVATVRGTAFFVDAASATNDVYVAEHLVSVSSVSGGAASEVMEGKRLRYAVPKAGAIQRLNTSAWKIEDAKDVREDAWVRGNLEKDASYKKRVEERLQGDLERFVPRLDMSVRVEAKERAALSKNRPDAQRVATRGLSRLVAEALAMAERGDVAATDALIKRAERFCQHAQASGAGCRVHPRLIEYVAHHADLASAMKDAALRASPDMAETLRRVLERREKFEKGTAPVSETVPVDEPSAAPIVTTNNETISPSVLPAPTAPKPLRLEISAQRFTFGFGESGSFSAFLRWSDGRSEDVTKQATWSLASTSGLMPIGQMRANAFFAGEVDGESKLNVSYQHTLGLFMASDTVRVLGPASPTVN